MNIKGQCHLLTLFQGHSDSTCSNLLYLDTVKPIEANFHTEPPWNVGMEICSKVLGPYMVKPSKISFFGNKWPMTLKLCICFLIHGRKLLQDIAMYFQACSTSA